jgi:uridine kinase
LNLASRRGDPSAVVRQFLNVVKPHMKDTAEIAKEEADHVYLMNGQLAGDIPQLQPGLSNNPM